MLTRFRCLAAAALLLSFNAVAGAQLASRPVDEWVKTLDTPQRIETLKIDQVVQKLKLKPGSIVADIGAGTGLFEGALAAAVAPGGTVYAEDIDKDLLAHIDQRAKELKVSNVRTVLGAFTDPKLPVRTVDLALINDVLHHIQDRAAFLKNLAGYLKPGGRIAIIDFVPEKGGHRDQPELQVTKDQARAWLTSAGLKPAEDIDLFQEKYFLIFSR